MKFIASKNTAIKLTFLLIILILIGTSVPIFSSGDVLAMVIVGGINFLSIVLLLWVYFKTEYQIIDETLICNSAFFTRKIPIQSISKITYHEGLIVPTSCKLSTDSRGFIITYDKYEEIFISPLDKDVFLNHLQSINPKIIYKP